MTSKLTIRFKYYLKYITYNMNSSFLLPIASFITQLAKTGTHYFFSIPIELIKAQVILHKKKYKLQIYEMDNNRALITIIERQPARNGKQTRFTIPIEIVRNNVIKKNKLYEVKVFVF